MAENIGELREDKVLISVMSSGRRPYSIYLYLRKSLQVWCAEVGCAPVSLDLGAEFHLIQCNMHTVKPLCNWHNDIIGKNHSII